VAVAGPPPAGAITRYLATASELPGFDLGDAEVKDSLKAWLAGEPKVERIEDAETFRAEGFRKAAFENFTAAKDVVGVSNVIVFSKAKGARKDQRALLHPIGGVKPFTIAGIPGAKAFSQAAGKADSADIIWVEGRCTLLVGEYAPRGRVAHKPLVKAAKAIYRRTKPRCP
jgi:hypothetical protein